MRIEPCEYEDLPPKLVEQARAEGADLDQSLVSPWVYFRAVLGFDTIGFVGVLLRSPSVVTLRGWWVRPRFRGQGIGTQLLEAGMTYASDAGVRKVELRTAEEHVPYLLGFHWTGYQRKGGKRERHFVRHLQTDTPPT